MKNKKLGSIYFDKDRGVFLVLNDDLVDKVNEHYLMEEAIDLVSEIEKFMLKILDREDD